MRRIDKILASGNVPTAAIYARFSSDNQRDESIDAQLRACGNMLTATTLK